MKKIFYFVVIILVSCKHDLEKPTWELDMIVPIAFAEMNITDIINESNSDINTSLNSDSLISLVYSSDILKSNYDNLLNIESTTDVKMFRIDSVKFDDVEMEYLTTIGSVIDELGPLGQALYPDGSLRDIPSLPNIIQNDSLEIDASDYFETMTLYNGKLNLEINNGFPTDISNMKFMLYNYNNQNLIASFDIPLIESVGFKFSFILSIVLTNCVIPSNAKNSVCKGTNNSSEATKDIIVSKLKEGGQSMNMLSYFFSIPVFSDDNISFKTNALFESLAVSTSNPDKFTCDPTISKFCILVFCIACSRLIFLINKL